MQGIRAGFLAGIATQLFPGPEPISEPAKLSRGKRSASITAEIPEAKRANVADDDATMAWLEARSSKSEADQLEPAFSSRELMMSRGSVRRLLVTGSWYNDEILNAWRHILHLQYPKRVRIMESHFFDKLSRGYDKSRILRWFLVSIPS